MYSLVLVLHLNKNNSKQRITVMTIKYESPLQNLLEQVQILNANIATIVTEEGADGVIKNYVTPILLALTNSMEQAFLGLNSVSQTASIALVTAEKTYASEVLENVSDITTDLSVEISDFVTAIKDRLNEADVEKLVKIENLLVELQEQVDSWNGDDEDEDDDEDEGDDEEGDDEGDDGEGEE